jgi:hypothetical protein
LEGKQEGGQLREICHSFIKQQDEGAKERRQNECEICNSDLQTEELFFITPSDLPPSPSSPESSILLNFSLSAAMCNKNAKNVVMREKKRRRERFGSAVSRHED